jgi:hypothetical protein
MTHPSFPIRKTLLACALALASLMFLQPTRAQTSQKKGGVEQELIRTETGFFEAWKAKDQTYFRNHIPADGVFWGESGTFSRDQQLQDEQASWKTCTIEGYGLSDFRVLPLATGAYLLTYAAEQYATCAGEKIPVQINGSSIYVFRDAHWQAIYRAQIPLKSQS